MTEAISRDWLFLGCQRGHDWQSIGGCNAGCHSDCACSVPVNECSRCGLIDYGENEEAADVRRDCALLRGSPAERFAEPERHALNADTE